MKTENEMQLRCASQSGGYYILAAVFDVVSCKILEDIILVKILQILETAAAGRMSAAVVLSVSGIFSSSVY